MSELEKAAEAYATKIAGGPMHDQAWEYVRRDFMAGAVWMREAAALQADYFAKHALGQPTREEAIARNIRAIGKE